MKELTLPNQIHMLVNNILGGLAPHEKPTKKIHPATGLPKARRDRPKRKDYFFYTQLFDPDTKELVGHMSDISLGGFKMDSLKPLPLNQDFRFSINLSSEVADKPSMGFTALSRWCKVDPIDPYVYNVGYQLLRISPEDLEIFKRLMEKYGRENMNQPVDLRRSNKW